MNNILSRLPVYAAALWWGSLTTIGFLVVPLLFMHLPTCRIPDDCIDSKRYPLFMARDVMRVLIEQLQAEGATPS